MKLLQLPLINMKISCKYPGLSLDLFSHLATCWILHKCLAWKMRTDSHIPSCCSISMHLLVRELSVWTHLLNQSSPPTCIERISFSVIHLCQIHLFVPGANNLYSIANAIQISHQTHVTQKLGEGGRKTVKFPWWSYLGLVPTFRNSTVYWPRGKLKFSSPRDV